MTRSTHSYDKPEISTQVEDGRYFYLHDRGVTGPRLVVVCGGRETCAADYAIDRPTFPYYGIEWVERGRGVLGLGGRSVPLQPGRSSATGRACRAGSGPTRPSG